MGGKNKRSQKHFGMDAGWLLPELLAPVRCWLATGTGLCLGAEVELRWG